ncbi:hypothetical protein [Pseudoalteromonas xiamenensis]
MLVLTTTGYNPYSGEKNSLYIEYAKKIKDDPNTFDWVAHGAVDRENQKGAVQMRNGDYKEAHQYAVSAFLERHGWKPGMDIRMLACFTGAMNENFFAQKLANKYNAGVYAPIGLLTIDSSGEIVTEFKCFNPEGQ